MFGKFNVYMFNPPYDESFGYHYIFDPSDDTLVLLNPKLSLEIGKSGSFEFVLPPFHRYIDSFHQLVTIVIVDMEVKNDSNSEDERIELFRGRVLTNDLDFKGNRKIVCEGCMSYLLDSVQRGFKFSGTVSSFLKKIIEEHNSNFRDIRDIHKQFDFLPDGSNPNDYIDSSLANRHIIIPGKKDKKAVENNYNYREIVLDSLADKWSTTFDLIEDCLINNIGGYLSVKLVNGKQRLEYRENYLGRATQHIEFGENLIDLTQELPADDIFTVLIPLGDQKSDSSGPITLNETDHEDIFDGRRLQIVGKEIRDLAALEKYGRIIRVESFSSVTSRSTLLDNGKRYLVSNLKDQINYEIKAVDMHFIDDSIEPIQIGQAVNILSLPHGINQDYLCTKIEYDLSNLGNSTFVFGNPRQDLTERYRKDKKKTGGGSRSSGSGSGKRLKGSGKTPSDTTATVGEVADAVDEATKATEKKAEKNTLDELTKFYNTYIHFSDNGDTLTIGDAVKKLGRLIGIDIDHDTGTIDIHSITELRGMIGENTARITTTSDRFHAETTLQATYADKTDSMMQAYLKVYADKSGSKIEGVANTIDFQSRKLNKLTGALTTAGFIAENGEAAMYSVTQIEGSQMESNARISTFSDETKAETSLMAKYTDENKNVNEAYLKVYADKSGSKIEGVASNVSLNTGKIRDVTGAFREAGFLAADGKSVLYSVTEIQNGIRESAANVTTYSSQFQAYAKLDASHRDAEGNMQTALLKVFADKSGTKIRGVADHIELVASNVKTGLAKWGIDIDRDEGIRIGDLSKKVGSWVEFKNDLANFHSNYTTFSPVTPEGKALVTIRGRLNAVEARFDSVYSNFTVSGKITSGSINTGDIHIMVDDETGSGGIWYGSSTSDSNKLLPKVTIEQMFLDTNRSVNFKSIYINGNSDNTANAYINSDGFISTKNSIYADHRVTAAEFMKSIDGNVYPLATTNDLSGFAKSGGNFTNGVKNGSLSASTVYANQLEVGSSGAKFHSGNGNTYNYVIDGGTRTSVNNGTISAGTVNAGTVNATYLYSYTSRGTKRYPVYEDNIDSIIAAKVRQMVKPASLITTQ